MNLFTSNFKYFFIAFIITVCISFFLTLLLVELELRNKNKKKIDYNAVSINHKSEFAAFGDSHVNSSFVSNEKIDNLGESSANINYIYDKIFYYINRKNNRIKGVIIQADPHMFSFYRLVSKKKYNTNKNNKSLNFFNFLHPSNRIYLLEYSKKVWIDLIYKKEKSVKKVQINNKKKVTFNTNSIMIRVQSHNPVNNFEKTIAMKKYKKIISFLQNNYIKICMITFPVSSQYRKSSNEFPNYKKVKKYFIELSNKNKNKIKYFDLSASVNDKYFKDPDHISKEFTNFDEMLLKKCNF